MDEEAVNLPINLPVNVPGAKHSIKTFGEMRREIKALESQMIATQDKGSAAYKELAAQAGTLNEKLRRTTEEVRLLSGTPMENLSRGFKGVGTSLKDLDFVSFNRQIAVMSQQSKMVTFKEMIGGIGETAKSFASLGKLLLTNPFMILVTAITLLIENFDKLEKVFPPLKIVMDAFKAAIGWIVDIIGKFTDFIGLTHIAASKAADEAIDASKRVQAEHEKMAAQNEKVASKLKDLSAAEIKQLKDKGLIAKDQETNIYKLREKNINQSINNNNTEIAALEHKRKIGDELTKDEEKELQDLKDKNDEFTNGLIDNAQEEAIAAIKANEEKNKKKAEQDKEYAKKREEGENEYRKMLRELEDETGGDKKRNKLNESYQDETDKINKLDISYKEKAQLQTLLDQEYTTKFKDLQNEELKAVQDKLDKQNELQTKANEKIVADAKKQDDALEKDYILGLQNKADALKNAKGSNPQDLANAEIAIIKRKNEDIQMDNDKTENEKVKSEQDSANQIKNINDKLEDGILEAKKKEIEEVENITKQGLNSIEGLESSLMKNKEDRDKKNKAALLKDKKEEFAIHKALSLVKAGINTAEAITKASPDPVMIALASVLGAVQIATIEAAQFNPGSEGGGGGSSGGGAGAPAALTAPQTFGIGSEPTAPKQNQGNTKVFVTEHDLSTVQNKVAVTQGRSTLS